MKLTSLISLTAVLSVPGFCFTPIATVSSAEPFTVNGRAITPSDTKTWPLEVGNEIATSTAPAVLFFPDGSSVKLAKSSRAQLTGTDSQLKLILLSGSLDYKVVLGSNLSVTNLDVERQMKRRAPSVSPATKPIPTPRGDEVTLTNYQRN